MDKITQDVSLKNKVQRV